MNINEYLDGWGERWLHKWQMSEGNKMIYTIWEIALRSLLKGEMVYASRGTKTRRVLLLKITYNDTLGHVIKTFVYDMYVYASV